MADERSTREPDADVDAGPTARPDVDAAAPEDTGAPVTGTPEAGTPDAPGDAGTDATPAEAAEPAPGDSGAEPREVTVPGDEKTSGDWKQDLRWAACLLLLAILGLSGWNNAGWQIRPEGREDLGGIVQLLLGEQHLVFLLQLLAVLLIVALVGAVVIALRDPESDQMPRGGV